MAIPAVCLPAPTSKSCFIKSGKLLQGCLRNIVAVMNFVKLISSSYENKGNCDSFELKKSQELRTSYESNSKNHFKDWKIVNMKIKIERRKWKVYWFFEKHLLFQGRIPSSSEQWGSPGIVRKWYQLLLISNFTRSLCLPRQIWQTKESRFLLVHKKF